MNRNKKMVTQADVAKEAGVSFITVSRVLNNSGYVKKETREKILKTIKKLNYYPNHIGQSLQKKKVNTIGIVIPEPPNVPVHGMEYYNMLMMGIDRVTVSNNYDMLLSTCNQDDPDVDYFRLYFQRKVDGLILFIPDMRYFDVDRIIKNNIPCVIIGEQPGQEINYVDADHFNGMYRAVQYIISKGITNICFIKGRPYMQSSIDRINGFKKAMSDNKIQTDDYCIYEGDNSKESGIDCMKKIISKGNIPDAVMCSNDLMAIGALTEAKKANIRIPEDMSLMGFDDISISGLIDPPLSTVRQPLFEMGQEASRILLKKIKNPDMLPVHKIFPVEMITRKSVK
jgi:LacI family transcriptional regulator